MTGILKESDQKQISKYSKKYVHRKFETPYRAMYTKVYVDFEFEVRSTLETSTCQVNSASQVGNPNPNLETQVELQALWCDSFFRKWFRSWGFSLQLVKHVLWYLFIGWKHHFAAINHVVQESFSTFSGLALRRISRSRHSQGRDGSQGRETWVAV